MLFYRLLICSLFLLPFFEAAGQDYLTEQNVSKREQKLYAEAKGHLNAGQGEEALKALEKALAKEPRFIDARLMYADLLLQKKEYAAAEAAFEQAVTLGPDYAPLAYYLLAEAAYEQQKFAEASAHLSRYLSSGKVSGSRRAAAEQLKRNADFAQSAVANPVPFEPIQLPPAVNTEHPEYLPSLTADEKLLVFTRRIPPGNEDIFYSVRTDTSWQISRPVPGLNSPASEASPSISANGKLMVFTRETAGRNFDLFYAEREKNGWSKALPVGPPVNTGAWESQPSLSANGTELYFASDRGGGQGLLDLWMSERLPGGAWGEPRNLGPVVNTPQNEQAPFIHPDGHTLYFMSKGHPGMGEYDLYYSRRQTDGSWGPPVNLGYPINTTGREGALVVSLDGQTAYFDSDKLNPGSTYQDIGNADLFSFPLYPAAQPRPVTYVQAVVRDARTRRPLVAEVDFVRLSNGQKHLSAQTDVDGEFLVVLPAGEDYALNVSKTGYLFHSENFALRETTGITDPFVLKIDLTPLPAPESETPAATRPVILRNVFFETGSAALQPESRTELEHLKELLVENPDLRIRINGHTDNVGTEEANQELSENRAKAVYDYLVTQGIDPARLQYKGFGESAPIAPNDTPEGRQTNRRTEFEVISRA